MRNAMQQVGEHLPAPSWLCSTRLRCVTTLPPSDFFKSASSKPAEQKSLRSFALQMPASSLPPFLSFSSLPPSLAPKAPHKGC